MSENEYRFVFACGGTGGHIFPALAVADALCRLEPRAKPVFVGVGGAIEQRLVSPAGYQIEQIPFVPLTGGGLKGLVRMLFALPKALISGLRLLRRIRPQAVIGFGGYPSVVPILSGSISGIPCALQEQNSRMGNANKLLSRFCQRVFVPDGASGFCANSKVKFLPNPVRRTFFEVPTWRPAASGEPFCLLIVGGSQGAVTLNDAIIAILPTIKELSLKVIHQAGKVDLERVTQQYQEAGLSNCEVYEFLDDIAAAYGKAQLVICRAGAMTAAEVCAAGRPAIYVPLRIAKGHQIENVRSMKSAGAAEIFEHGPELAQNIDSKLRELVADSKQLGLMADKAAALSKSAENGEDSATTIAKYLLSLAD